MCQNKTFKNRSKSEELLLFFLHSSFAAAASTKEFKLTETAYFPHCAPCPQNGHPEPRQQPYSSPSSYFPNKGCHTTAFLKHLFLNGSLIILDKLFELLITLLIFWVDVFLERRNVRLNLWPKLIPSNFYCPLSGTRSARVAGLTGYRKPVAGLKSRY